MADPLPTPTPLRDFLADRDQPCPHCAYNLRGVAEPVCPECGHALELALQQPASRLGHLLVLLLACTFVLIGAGLDAARAGRAVYSEATSTSWFQVSSIRATRRIALSAQTIVLNGQGTTIQTSPTRIAFGQTTGPAAATWSNVQWQTWTRLGWSGTLALSALVGLAVVLIARRRIAGHGPGRAVLLAALSLPALYLGGHIFLFVRELVG